MTTFINLDDVSEKTRKAIVDYYKTEYEVDLMTEDETEEEYVSDNFRIALSETLYLDGEKGKGTYRFIEYMTYLRDGESNEYFVELEQGHIMVSLKNVLEKLKEVDEIQIDG